MVGTITFPSNITTGHLHSNFHRGSFKMPSWVIEHWSSAALIDFLNESDYKNKQEVLRNSINKYLDFLYDCAFKYTEFDYGPVY